jgi:chromosome segregation ATPase
MKECKKCNEIVSNLSDNQLCSRCVSEINEVGLDAQVYLTNQKIVRLEGSTRILENEIRFLKNENKKKDEKIEALELKVNSLEAQLKRLNAIERILFNANQEYQTQIIQPAKK